MRFFDAPKVILVARPSLVSAGVDELMAEYGLGTDDWKRGLLDTDGESLPELMGRLCYGSFGPRQGRVGAHQYLRHILEAGHGSVLEHANWSFVLVRGSRGLTHQVVRHRAGWAYSQESTHFVRYDSAEGMEGQEAGASLCALTGEERETAGLAIEAAVRAYVMLWTRVQMQTEGKTKTQVKKATCAAVRGLLPTALESKLGFTANARALRHFIELRGAEDNVPEIRYVAADLARIMKDEAPAIFSDYTEKAGQDSHPVVTATAYKKV